MTDLFPALTSVGDVLDEERATIVACEVNTAQIVVKGQAVDLIHQASGLPKVQLAGIDSVIAGGIVVALGKLATGAVSGAAGVTVQVLVKGTVKVTAGGTVTVGKLVKVGGMAGRVVDSAVYGDVLGKALQTMASGDTGLIIL